MSAFSFNSKGLSFAARVILGCIIVWWSLEYIHDPKKIWALISVVVVSDPSFDALRSNAISRLVNTVMGCIVGLIFVYLFGVGFLGMMTAVAVSVIISTSFKNYPSSWKLAPVTVIILMIPYTPEGETWKEAMHIALTRTGEVLYGSLIAFLLGLVYLKIEGRIMKKKQVKIYDAPTGNKEEHE
jgi:uncharacterized membrane protein YccC